MYSCNRVSALARLLFFMTSTRASSKPRVLSMSVRAVYRFSEVTPLAFACMVGDLPLVAYVSTHGGGDDVTRADYGGWTPLLRAARQGSVDVVAWLCSHGAGDDVWRPNIKGDTPIGEAARMGHLRVVQVGKGVGLPTRSGPCCTAVLTTDCSLL
jgi:ankyrin repeat protein